MRWLDLFSQFDITIYNIPGKSNGINNALLYCPDLAGDVGLVESGLLTWIREA